MPANPWAPFPETARPHRGRSRGPRRSLVLGAVIGVVLLALIGAGLHVYVVDGNVARVAAGGYLQALERGDTAAAYQAWCAADRAAYPEAEFRAQHEWRTGHHSTVLSTSLGARRGSHTASVLYRDVKTGDVKDLYLERAQGRWEVCPQGTRLTDDMQNCGCMTPGQHLEADVASVLARPGSRYSLVEVSCPAIPALVDGRPVHCTGRASDGRTWAIIATESDHATYTHVSIAPTGTVR